MLPEEHAKLTALRSSLFLPHEASKDAPYSPNKKIERRNQSMIILDRKPRKQSFVSCKNDRVSQSNKKGSYLQNFEDPEDKNHTRRFDMDSFDDFQETELESNLFHHSITSQKREAISNLFFED